MIILIDHNKVSNFFTIQQVKSSKHKPMVLCFEETLDALNYISSLNAVSSEDTFVFINVDMPDINGWEFIERHMELQDNQGQLQLILMVKSELDTEEEIRISKYPNVSVIHPHQINSKYIDNLLKGKEFKQDQKILSN